MPELMKGKVWHEHKHRVQYPVLAEPKFDEIRCHVIVHPSTLVEFLSYSGKPLANMAVFTTQFVRIAFATGYKEFDCGFEVNSNFNDSYRWVRSTKQLPADLVYARTKFILFDLPECPDDYVVRKLYINRVANLGGLSIAEGTCCDNEAEVDAAFVKAREHGLEGLMIKTLSHTYQRGKRISGWLKMKPESDADGTITSINEAVSDSGVPQGRAGSVTVAMGDGSTASPHGIAHALGRDMFENPSHYIGQCGEFKYMERDRQGGYRHPTWHRLRES